MDDLTFQYELHQLKQQVEGMAVRHGKTPLPSVSVRDGFLAQMRDLKAHLAGLDRKFTDLGGSQEETASFSPTDGFVAQMRDLKTHLAGLDRKFTDLRESQEAAARERNQQFLHTTQTANERETSMLPPHNRLAMPSAPLFWHLFTTLRTDVQGLDGRVASVEQTVSDLEDKVDGMSDLRLTPSSSVTGYDETPQHGSAVPTLAASARGTHPAALDGSYKASMLQAKADLARAAVKMLHRYDGTFKDQSAHLSKHNAKLARSIVQLNDKLHEVDWERKLHELDWDPKHGDTAACADDLEWSQPADSARGVYLDEPAAELPDLLSGEQIVSAPQEAAQKPCHVSLEGTAFRDQELARMDELLRNAQEDLAASEQRMHEQREELQTAQGRYRGSNEELLLAENQLARLNHVLTEKDKEIESLREKGSQWWASHQSKLARAEEQIGRMDVSLRELHRSEVETKRMLRARSEDIHSLQRFCDQKDEVFRKQEEVITRGARLLEERDDEIEAISRRLKGMDDDRQHELRQQARLTKLLEERDAELSDMKAAIASACAVTPRSFRMPNGELQSSGDVLMKAKARLETCAQAAGVPGPADCDSVDPDGSFEAKGELKGERNHKKQKPKSWDEPALPRNMVPEAQSWSPRPIRGDRQLRDEARRASAWEQGEYTSPTHVFGQASPLGNHRPRAAPKSVRAPSRIPMRYTDDEKVLEDAQTSFGEQGAFMHPQADNTAGPAQRSSGRANNGSTERRGPQHATGRHGLPLDNTILPPLPAPVPPQRMQSTIDLRSRARNEPQRGLTKHQSMQNLPRRKLQAYVETEESCGELGGEV